MSTTNEPDFDWSQAASLLGDDPQNVPKDMAAIVQELVEGAEAQFKELKMKSAAVERKSISSLAHQLRGCLLNFGFTAVGEVLVQIEKGSYTADEYHGLIDKAEADFVTCRKMLAKRYPSAGLS